MRKNYIVFDSSIDRIPERDYSKNMPPIDQNKLITAAIIVALFGILILSFTYILPLLGILVALGVIIAAIAFVYFFLTGKIKF